MRAFEKELEKFVKITTHLDFFKYSETNLTNWPAMKTVTIGSQQQLVIKSYGKGKGACAC